MTHTTPNMNLVLPDVLMTAGPGYAYLLDAAEYLVDAHDHSSGKGVQVTPAGLNISSDLTFAQNNATNLRTARLFNNVSLTPGVSDLTCLYAVADELFYRDGAGNVVQITLSGALDLSSGLAALTIKDTNFFVENASDITKKMRLNVSAIPTGTTRILSVPDSGANDTFVTLAATQTLTNKTLTAPVINSPTGITKSDVGLSNVDNTSDATKNSAVATLSNKSVTGPLVILADTTVQFNNSTNTFSTSLKAGTNLADVTFSLPIVDGINGQILTTDGSANLSFQSVPAAPPANIAANDSNVVFTSADNTYQICTPTAPRTYTMPATLTAGIPWVFYNQATSWANIITIQTSGTNTITIVPPQGFVTIVPLTSTPTAAANWYLQDRQSAEVAYTPTYTSFGTTSSSSASAKVTKNTLCIRFSFTSGTPTAALASISIPLSLITTGLINNNTTGSGSCVGDAGSGGGNSMFIITAPATSTTLVYVGATFSSASNPLVPANANTMIVNGAFLSANLEVPIA